MTQKIWEELFDELESVSSIVGYVKKRHTVVFEGWRGMLLSFEGCTDVPCLGQHLLF